MKINGFLQLGRSKSELSSNVVRDRKRSEIIFYKDHVKGKELNTERQHPYRGLINLS